MMRLLSKKLTYMEGGYMLDSSDLLIGVLGLMGGLFGMMLGFYIVLCFIQWVSDVIDEKRWMIWKEWFIHD
jgi:hypothetical protein